ncbi:hypothetical protein N0O92_05930 [Alkalihalobacillus sp. MEB130]|uniref:hypothetical protein n=1 Tax=Alkalihalobacillus sp. MEB130 TaxID=2976704 RepID=UPI0028DEF2D8|nr:hypothetical protein [Alkalihalobacillus sp. MEB130]MDT8859766.1 hypothetical protein [Alkalihalobacillus sp. MEB130]
MDKKKLEFEYDLGMDLDLLNLGSDIETKAATEFDFHEKFLELCISKLKKKANKDKAQDMNVKDEEQKVDDEPKKEEEVEEAKEEEPTKKEQCIPKIKEPVVEKEEKEKKEKKQKKETENDFTFKDILDKKELKGILPDLDFLHDKKKKRKKEDSICKELKNIMGLPHLKNLKDLNKLKHLKDIDKLDDLDDLKHLKKLKHLKQLKKNTPKKKDCICTTISKMKGKEVIIRTKSGNEIKGFVHDIKKKKNCIIISESTKPHIKKTLVRCKDIESITATHL